MAITTTSGSLRANALKLHRAISILDLETTGNFVEIDRIVEIEILKVLNDATKRRFSQRVNPEMKIPQEGISSPRKCGKGDGWLVGEENQQVNGERPGAFAE